MARERQNTLLNTHETKHSSERTWMGNVRVTWNGPTQHLSQACLRIPLSVLNKQWCEGGESWRRRQSWPSWPRGKGNEQSPNRGLQSWKVRARLASLEVLITAPGCWLVRAAMPTPDASGPARQACRLPQESLRSIPSITKCNFPRSSENHHVFSLYSSAWWIWECIRGRCFCASIFVHLLKNLSSQKLTTTPNNMVNLHK